MIEVAVVVELVRVGVVLVSVLVNVFEVEVLLDKKKEKNWPTNT